MFRWLRRLWERRKRNLFRFWDGERMRAIDPLRAYMAIRDHKEFNLAEHYRLADNLEEPETTYLRNAVKEAFGVRDFDGESGLTTSEMFDLLVDLLNYLSDLQKKSPTSSPPSEPTESESSTGLESGGQTTNSTSQPSTVSNEPSCNEAPLSPTPSAQETNGCCP